MIGFAICIQMSGNVCCSLQYQFGFPALDRDFPDHVILSASRHHQPLKSGAARHDSSIFSFREDRK